MDPEVPAHWRLGKAKVAASDPGVSYPSAFVEELRAAVRSFSGRARRQSLQTADPDYSWESYEPILCRVDHDLLLAKLLEFVNDISERDGERLYAWVFAADGLTNLLGSGETAAVRQAWDALNTRSTDLSKNELFAEASLAKMRRIGACYLVGTPKGRLSRLEQAFFAQPWAKVREGVQVKRLATKEDVYVLAQSHSRIGKERGMRRKRLRRYVDRLLALQAQTLTRDQLLMKLGAARQEAGRAAGLVKVTIPKSAAKTASLQFRIDRDKLRQVRAREGRYLLRTNLTAGAPEQLWSFYIQLTEVEQAFKELKHDLAVRPIFHRTEERIEAHIFVAFLAHCLQVTLKARLKSLAGGITPREVLAKFKTMQMVDVHIPTTDGRELILSRYTQPEPEHRMLLQGMRMQLPEQPPPKITPSNVQRLVTGAAAA